MSLGENMEGCDSMFPRLIHHSECEDHSECEGCTPPEPRCSDEHDGHAWEPHGGLRENPGVWSEGGTVMRYDAWCVRCRLRRSVTSYGVQRDPGQCDRVSYDARLARPAAQREEVIRG